jgi:hypothetical protein
MVIEAKSLTGEDLPRFDAPVRDPAGPSPLRRPGSVRRTSDIMAHWPEGRGGPTYLDGIARDYVTSFEGEGETLALDRIWATADRRTITALRSDSPRAAIGGLVGASAGHQLRGAIVDVLPGERAGGTPLYLLLDDLAGTTLVANWSFSRWPVPDGAGSSLGQRKMEGICIGFRPGSPALTTEGTARPGQNCISVEALAHPDDPDGWHDLRDPGGINFRRARRTDVWRGVDGCLEIEGFFQDSASSPDGRRMAIHEYSLRARADDRGRLAMVEATPGTLPYAECRAAPVNIAALIGLPLNSLREEVLARLYKSFGCTHLNDMLRSLAEVPVLARHLPPPE